MTTTDARQFAITEQDREYYFRVDRAKGNYSPPAAKATWRHFANVELLNGDDVGVVEAWDCPGQGEITGAMAAAQELAETVFLALLVRFTLEDRQVNDTRHQYYAPRLFADEPEAKDAKVGKVALEDAMKRLLKDKRIRIIEKQRKGREARFLVVA